MLFRKPNGEVVENGVSTNFCTGKCNGCKIYAEIKELNCTKYIHEHPYEAAAALGYEAIPTGGEKPRICELLFVDINEIFEIKGRAEKEYRITKFGGFQMKERSTFWVVGDQGDLLSILNHPDLIKVRHGWTSQEISDAETLMRMFHGRNPEATRNSKGKLSISYDGYTFGTCGITFKGMQLFPSLRPGESVKISEIAEGNR